MSEKDRMKQFESMQHFDASSKASSWNGAWGYLMGAEESGTSVDPTVLLDYMLTCCREREDAQ